ANAMPPRRGCRLAVANEAFFHNAQFVIIRPMPAAFTIGCGKYFDLRTIDKVGHKLGLTIGLSLRSDGHRRRFTTETIKGAEHPLRLFLYGYPFALQPLRRATPCPHKRKTPRRGLHGVSI
ncbi:hypothetical protein, partial [Sulfitobacter pontiacus]|uniref:hypothetical protein n=1 Tax=Sulfitobacter pontiacus TaxID=60137 RepID=UPI0030EEB72E